MGLKEVDRVEYLEKKVKDLEKENKQMRKKIKKKEKSTEESKSTEEGEEEGGGNKKGTYNSFVVASELTLRLSRGKIENACCYCSCSCCSCEH